MRKIVIGLALTLVLVLRITPTAMAGSEMSRILDRGELLVGTTGSQPPLNATDKQGNIIGMDVDLAKGIADGLGVRLKLVPLSFSELLPALEAGRIDMVLSGLTMTLERNRSIGFVGPYFVSGKGILTKTENIATLQQKDALDSDELRLAVLKDSTSEAFVEKASGKAVLIRTTSYDEALDLLFKDEVDALVADYPYCLFAALRYPDRNLQAGESSLSFEPLGIAVREDVLLFNWLRNYLEIIKQKGTLKEIHARWFKSGDWLKTLP